MPELAEMETPKTAGFVDRGYNNAKRKQRMEEEAKEIERLEAEARGETPVDAEEVEEATQEAETNTEAKEETLSAEEKSFKKRYGDLRRHMQQKEKEWDEKLESLQSSKASVVPPKSDEDIEQWAEKYPDVAGIVETIATKKAQEMFDKADTRLKELSDAQSETQRIKAENKIRESHSDFDKLREADDFHNWADEQPKWVKDALYENADDPASVVRVIDLYKIDKGLTLKDKKANKKAAASTVTKRSKTQVDVADANEMIRESEVAKMTDKEFEERADEINKAMRSGKFVYDVSGNAR
jgi:cytochrome c556